VIAISVLKHAVGDPPCWQDLDLERTTHLQGPPTQIVVIEAGMTSGRSAVAMRLGMPDGAEVVVEWSLAAFVAAARAAEAFAGTWGES
jgi:hypothetical protein